MKKGDYLLCTADRKLYTLIDIPFMGTGLTYFEISDGANNYFVRNGRIIWDKNGDFSDKYFNFNFCGKNESYFKEYSNKFIPNHIKKGIDIKFDIKPISQIRKQKLNNLKKLKK